MPRELWLVTAAEAGKFYPDNEILVVTFLGADISTIPIEAGIRHLYK